MMRHRSTPHVIDLVHEAAIRNYHVLTDVDTPDMTFLPPVLTEAEAEREVELAVLESVMVTA